ncbi:Amuc_1098 family type IV pilus outer membrane protein [Rubritalea marina]|uniref:Amuc_1098 family type IV pilus outer membrane protein n=1 Tax=Rubritalea marina TaxID=361055 RepID=UPI000380B724|nr:Amuc_1098 family type IV pilus outer membrane protein [Rubritalea marina]
MHRIKLNHPSPVSRASAKFAQQLLVGMAVCASSSSLIAGDRSAIGASVQMAGVNEVSVLATELLATGDAAYQAAAYDKAVKDYREAHALVSQSTQPQQVKDAVALRYAQAAVEQAKVLVRVGSYDAAREQVAAIIAPGVMPSYGPGKQLLAEIDDPIRTNPALTYEHTQATDEVRRLLYKAQGYTDLGRFDDALVSYEEVLLIDRHNSAARRGMEKVVSLKSEYFNSAKDHTRAEMLAEVDGSWEIPVTPKAFAGGSAKQAQVDRVQEVYANQLRQTVVPVVDLYDATLEEAYDMVRVWSREYDTTALDPANRGMNFVLNLGDSSNPASQEIRNKRVTLNLRNVPLIDVLDFISKATSTRWYNDQHVVRVTPIGEADSTIFTRSYKVPPLFMKDAVAAVNAAVDDPFSDGASNSAGAASAQDLLQQVGVQFPDGASARYIKRTNTLMVANTQSNLGLIEEYVRTFSDQEQAQVVLKVTIMDVNRDDLEELGFDWLVNNNQGSGTVVAGGGTQGNGFAVAPPGDASFDGFNPVTSGLRSGDTMFDTSVDDLVAAGATSYSGTDSLVNSTSRAPGILTLRTEDVAVIMRGLSQKKNTDSMDRPSVIMRSGEKASIFSGREMLYPTEYEPPELPTQVDSLAGGVIPVSPSHPTAFETRFIGVEMEAECVISEDKNYVDVQLVASTTDFDGFVDYGSPISTSATNDQTGELSTGVINNNSILMPIFRPFRINTAVTVRDGYSFVIGGLNQSDVESVHDSVPILGDIPLLGRFFKSEGVRKTDRALLFFVHVELKDPTGKNWNEQVSTDF